MNFMSLFSPKLRQLEKMIDGGYHANVRQMIASADSRGDKAFLKAAAPIVAEAARANPQMGIAALKSHVTYSALTLQDKLNIMRHVAAQDRMSDEDQQAIVRLTSTSVRMDKELRDAVTDKDVLSLTNALLGHYQGERTVTHLLTFWKYPSKDIPQAVQLGLLDLYSAAVNRGQYGRLAYLVSELPTYANEMTHFPPQDIVVTGVRADKDSDRIGVILDPRVGQPLLQTRDSVFPASQLTGEFTAKNMGQARISAVGAFLQSVAGNENVAENIRRVASRGTPYAPVLALAGKTGASG